MATFSLPPEKQGTANVQNLRNWEFAERAARER